MRMGRTMNYPILTGCKRESSEDKSSGGNRHYSRGFAPSARWVQDVVHRKRFAFHVANGSDAPDLREETLDQPLCPGPVASPVLLGDISRQEFVSKLFFSTVTGEFPSDLQIVQWIEGARQRHRWRQSTRRRLQTL